MAPITLSALSAMQAEIAAKRQALDQLEAALSGYVGAFGRPLDPPLAGPMRAPTKRTARKATRTPRRPAKVKATKPALSIMAPTTGSPADRLLDLLKDGPVLTSTLKRTLKLSIYRFNRVIASLGSRVTVTGTTNSRMAQLAPTRVARPKEGDQFETVWSGKGPLPGAAQL